MLRKSGFLRVWIAIVLLSLTGQIARAQRNEGRSEHPRRFTGQQAPVLVNQSIDENNQASLPGNTRPEATPQNDGGAVPDNYFMDHMLLQLKRSAEQEQALQQYIQELQTKGSPNYQHWLSAQEFGERFGVSRIDIETLTRWLEKHGLTVNVVYTSGMVIDFSGTAKQVREAFHTDIHKLHVKGKNHVGNINDPKIPAALSPLVAGIVSLNDFAPHAMHEMRKSGSFTFNDGFGGTAYAVAPADLATIYNLNPLFNAGFTGQGQTIVVVEDTDIFSKADWTSFRSKFGLSKYTAGSFKTVYPAPVSGSNNCNKPGIVAQNDAEAILDAEWASAAAPSAAIEMATCADTTVTFGGLIAIQNLINASSLPPAIMSVSYGQCETENGAAANAAYNSAYQQAVVEGVSVFVAAGDSGAAGCDNSVAQATHGIGVNAFASTPYNVAVGGTDFSDTYNGNNSIYWNSTNTATFGSARSYIPEIPWNDSCAGALFASYEGFNITAGPNSFCNDPTYGPFVSSTVGGGGGPSACATGTPNVTGVVGGSCQGWPKPSWQAAVPGNPNDGVRDTPDVSLFAADGLWGHYYIFCWSDTANGGAACTGSPSGWSGAGGTSFASPIMAGIQALVNQKSGARQGNPNPVYYQLAANEYNSSNGNACNSSNGTGAPNSCIFYDVTQGDMDVDCTGTANCFLDGGAEGVLSTSNTLFQPAYAATTGWDFATGIGSVNAANLVNNWPGSKPTFTLSTSASSVTVGQGGSGTTSVIVTPWNGFNGSVSFSASGLPSGVTASFNPTSTQTTTTLTLAASSAATVGTSTITITGNSGSLSSSTTITVSVVTGGSFSLLATPANLTVAQGASGTSTISIAAQGGFGGTVNLSASGLPSGVTASFNPSSTASSSSLTLTASSSAPTGNATVTVTGTSGGLTIATSISLTVVPAPTFTLSVSPSGLSLSQGASGATMVSVVPQAGFTGAVSLTASGLPAGVAASFNPAVTTTASTLTLTASSTAATGLAAVTITGTSGSLSKTTTLNVALTSPPLLTTWLDQDVGVVGVAGSASYANGSFTISGSGQQIWGTADGMNYLYQPLSGDGSIVARILSLQGGMSTQAVGVMIRETLAANSSNVYAGYGQSLTFLDFRNGAGNGTSAQQTPTVTLPYWVKLTRSGNTFTGYSSLDGVNWAQIGVSQNVSMAQNVYVGVAITGATDTALATAMVDNVSVNLGTASAPVITTVSSTTGNIGSQVVLSGGGFGVAQNGSAVFLNGTPLSVNLWTANSITVTVPAGATSGPLAVSVAPNMNYSNPVTFTVTAQPLPNGWLDQDVGTVGKIGNASYSNGTFTVQGSGNQIWGNADQMHFVYEPWSGDATIVARAVSLQGGGSTQGTGVMVRETLSTSSANVITGFGQGISFLDYRSSTAGSTATQQGGPAALPGWVKLVRSGDTFTAYTSPDGMNWTQVGSAQTIPMAANVYIGMAVCSATNSVLAVATFDNVSLSSPTSPNFALSASPAGVSVVQGGSAATTINIAPQNAFSGAVSLSVTGLPAGVTGAFNPGSTSSSSLLTLTADNSAAAGNFTATITGNSGTLTNTTTVGVSVVIPPSFTLSAAPGSLSVVQGSYGAATITIAGQNGFSGAVSLAASGLPTGVTASFSPASATASSALTLTASGSATLGSATVVVTGTSGSLTATTSVALTVTTAPSFTLSALPGSLSVVQGASGSSTISINGQNGFSSAVNLLASGLPAGVTASFNPASASGSSTLTLTASSSAAPGSATVTVTGTSGSLTATTSVVLTVTAAPSFTLSASPNSVSVVQGTSGSSTINVTGQNGFNSAVSLAASGLPAGVTATFTPASATTSSTLTLTASSSAALGSATVTVTGTSGSLTATTSVVLTVTAAPSFTLSASPSSVSVVQGTSGSTTINVTGQNGFSGAVALSASGLPAGVTASFNPASATTSSILTLTASNTATTGTVNLTITGSSGSLTASTGLILAVTAAPTNGLPSGWNDTDIGSVSGGGSANFSSGTFTVNGGGSGVWSSADGFNFAYQQVTGDTTIVARLLSIQNGALSQTTGVMIRETLDPGATNLYATFGSGALLYFDDRPSTGGNTVSQNTASSVALPYWVKIVRSGNIFSGYSSVDGVNWTQIGISVSVPMAANVYVGLAVSSNEGNLATATFDNVAVTVPAPPTFTLGASPSPLNITQGTSGTSTVTINPQSGFSGSVNLSVAGLPAGVTASFNPATATASSALTLTASSSAAVGPSTLTITGVSSSGSSATTLALNITQAGLPTGWSDSDIGSVGTAGSATFANGTFTVKGAGNFIWSTADGFNFAYQPVTGDSTIIARMLGVGGGAASETTGIMVRETLATGATNVYATFGGNSLLYFDDRPSTNGSTVSQNMASPVTLPYWVKIVRRGNVFSGYSSVDGLNWTQIGASVTVNMATNVYVGLAVSSNSGGLATATFDNVSVTTP